MTLPAGRTDNGFKGVRFSINFVKVVQADFTQISAPPSPPRTSPDWRTSSPPTPGIETPLYTFTLPDLTTYPGEDCRLSPPCPTVRQRPY